MKSTGIWNQKEADTGHIFSYRLAQYITSLLNKETALYDMGCGKGAYIKYFQDMGFKNVLGIEGERLKDFESENILVQDLTNELNLAFVTDFDFPQMPGNVICLEVAEHIPAGHTDMFLKNICDQVLTGHRLILSWAIPGQEGYGHVNCQHNIWVINEIEKRGFKFHYPETAQARHVIESHCNWFKNTLLIFHKTPTNE